MKRYLSILCALLFASSLMAQQANGFVNQLPDFPKISTPMAASFQKYIDNPINLYNGTPDISIPLLNIKDGDIDLPIALRYNSSGIRANEEASWVGLGWNLNVGGVITQSVVGESDYNDTEYANLLNALGLSGLHPLNKFGSVGYGETLQAAIKSYFGSPNLLYHSGKLNPDVFYYSYPGGSGKFIIDYRDNSIHQLNREENVKIEISAMNDNYAIDIAEFRITTMEGIVHTFSYRTSVYPNDQFYRPVSASFVLTSSVYPNGQLVRYEYTTTAVKYLRRGNVFQTPFDTNIQEMGSDYSFSTETVMTGTEFYMNKMWTTHYEVTFNLADRDDVYGGKQLTSIQVTPRAATSSVLKDVRFSYTYFVASSTTPGGYIPGVNWRTEYDTKRLRLDSVYHQQGTQKNDCYSFEYNSTVPNKYTYNVDYWGYYNGISGLRRNTFLPDISQMKWGRFYTLSPQIDLYQKFQNRAIYSNRAYSFTDCQAGILRRVNYPTGGYVTYEYEPNSFMDKKVPDKTSETIINEDWNLSSGGGPTNFSVPANVTATVEVWLKRGLNTWQEVWEHGGGSFTLLHMSSGTPGIILTHSFKEECLYYANHYPNAGEIIFKTTISLPQKDVRDYPYTYILSADFPASLGLQYGASTKHGSTWAQITYGLSTAMVDAEMQGCGLRVKSIKQYENVRGVSTLQLETGYEYVDPHTNVCSGILHEQVMFVKPYYGTLNFVKLYNNNEMLRQNVAEVTSENTISNPYSTIGGVGYSYVKETRKSTNTIAGYTVYQFYNDIPDYVFGNIRMDAPLNGKLLSINEHKSASTLLKSETYTYRNNLSYSHFGVSILDYMNMFTSIYASDPVVKPIPFDARLENPNGDYPGRLRIPWHSIRFYDITMTKKVSVQDGVSTTEEYAYDPSTLQLLRKTIKPSGSDSLTYAYSYPNHFNFSPYTNMAQQNRIKPVIETRLLKGGNMKKGVLTRYASQEGKIVPVQQYESDISGNIGNPTTLTANGANASVYPYANIMWNVRDKYGNPIDVNAAGVNTVYLWAYENRYPVVKIEGATYAQVQGWLTVSTINALAANNTTVDTALTSIRSTLSDKNVLVTTYTYLPLVGMTSMTTPNGVVTRYEYDPFGRLIKTRDGDDKVIEQYDYHYRN